MFSLIMLIKGKSILLDFSVFFKIFYCYSITVVCLFSPSLHPTPSKPPSLQN